MADRGGAAGNRTRALTCGNADLPARMCTREHVGSPPEYLTMPRAVGESNTSTGLARRTEVFAGLLLICDKSQLRQRQPCLDFEARRVLSATRRRCGQRQALGDCPGRSLLLLDAIDLALVPRSSTTSGQRGSYRAVGVANHTTTLRHLDPALP